MAYSITQYSYRQAKKLGVTIKPSEVKGKKIDVFNKKGEKIASVGYLGMNDYPTWIRKMGKDFADRRRKAYKSDIKMECYVRN